MSWEVSSINEIQCPCGKGKIKQVIKDDDWGRIKEETPVIECKECAGKYNIIKEYVCPKPKHDYTVYYCVSKDNDNEKVRLNL